MIIDCAHYEYGARQHAVAATGVVLRRILRRAGWL